MKAPLFLDFPEILELHLFQIRTYGGAPGVRDRGLLESALGMPQAGFGDHYFHKDLFEMGAAYLYHIVQNHPFFDGNKRTASDAAITFMKMNGVIVEAPDEEMIRMVLAVAEGKLHKPEIAAFLREHARK